MDGNDERMNNVLIIGYGVVGKHLKAELSALDPDVYDKYTFWDSRRTNHYDLAFVCVPTPYLGRDKPCDTSEIEAALAEHDADLFILKSAVLPGVTDRLCQETGKHIIVSPEYHGSTVHSNSYSFDFTILGGEKADCLKAVQILQCCYDGRHRFHMTDTKTAELVKYMENAYLVTKVSFCCQFWEIANKIGVNYPELRELFLLDPRVNPSHTFVFDEHPYWDSPCLNKDVPAIANTYDADFLKAVIRYNSGNLLFYGGETTGDSSE